MNPRSTGLAKLSSLFLRLALGTSFLSAVADRFGLWGASGQPERVVGRLRPIRGLYGQAQLVFAGGNDSDVSDARHGC